MDLLRVKWLRRLLKSAWVPLAVQVAMLVAFALLVWGGLGVADADDDVAGLARYTNLANLLVWCCWFPLVIVGAVVLGRVWCAVCPMELATTVASRIGLRRPVPAFLKSGWAITILYGAAAIVGVYTLGVHRVPHRMAVYLVALLALALTVGLVFEKRAFCSHVCPVGHLLGLYAHCSVLQWRAADASVCNACEGKDCVAKSRRLGIRRRSCTSGLYPPAIQDNRDCLLCTQCLKVCPSDNLCLAVRAPWSDLRRPLGLTGAQLAFLAIVSGFVIFEVLSEWEPSLRALEWLPYLVADAFGLTGPAADLAAAGVMFVLLPAALFLVVAGGVRLAARTPVFDGAKAFALLLLPTVTGAQVVKAILKTTGHLPYWKVALADPAGVESARAIQAGTLAFDPSLPGWLTAAITVVVAMILVVALIVTVRLAHTSPWTARLPRAARPALVAAAATYWAIFAVTIVLWRF